MQDHSSQARSADAFGYLDKPVRRVRRGEESRRLLFMTVAARLHRIDLPKVKFRQGHGWGVNAQDMDWRVAQSAIVSRVRLARRHGFDLRSIFEIDELGLRGLALSLASLLHDARSGGLELDEQGRPVAPTLPRQLVQTIPGHEDLVSLIGLPGEKVKDLGKWFRKALLRHERRVADYFAQCISEIGKFASPVVCEAVLASRARQLERQAQYAASHCFVSLDDSGKKKSINFSDAASNAHRRASKTYARLKGLDVFCTERGLVGYFVTFTLPSSYHSNPSDGENSWDGATPSEGHDELQRKWRSFQRRFGESGGKCYGVRVEEPHNDGCAHWHLLMYVSPERTSAFLDQIEKIFGSEPATKIEPVDRRKGTGATYLMKYIRPVYMHDPLDGLVGGETVDLGSDGKSSKTARYDAYRSTWGGRCIQFFDVPGSATVWDEMRRIRPESKQFMRLDAHGLLLHAAARATNYAEFLALLIDAREAGDVNCVRVVYAERDSGTKYIKGLEVNGASIDTHEVRWTIEDAPADKDWAAKKLRTVMHSFPRNAQEAQGAERHLKEATDG